MTYTNHPKFTGRNVPIAEIARATGKNPQFIRIGLQHRLTAWDTPVRYRNEKRRVIRVYLLLL